MWHNISPAIQALGFRVYLIDLPCHGKSRFQGEICTMGEMASLLDAFCIDKKIETPTIFGHSMGGYVGLELLKLRSVKLALVHSNFWADPIQKKRNRDRVVTIVRENKMRLINEAIPNLFAPINRDSNSEEINKLMDTASTIPAAEIIAATRGMRDRLDNTELLNHHSIHIIHGDSDPIIPTKQLTTGLDKTTQKHTLQTIKNCGHMSPWESPATLINSLKCVVFK
jgi:pimeloyl-ACP methyl ester carboxylesterase